MPSGVEGQPKILKRCTLPLSGQRPVDMIVTEVAVFEVRSGRLVLTEVASGLSLADIQAKGEAHFDVAADLTSYAKGE